LIDNVSDLAIFSRGAVSYEEIKQMTPREFVRFHNRLNKYYKDKAAAMDAAAKGR